MATFLAKASLIWLVMVAVAIANGVFREKALLPLTGTRLALPLSGVILSALIFVVSLITIPFIGKASVSIYIAIGAYWVILTLLFEFLLGHYLAGKSWREVVQVFNIMKGDLFAAALVTSAVSPLLAAKLRGLL